MAHDNSSSRKGARQFKASQVGFAGLTVIMLVVLLASLGGQMRAPFPLELVTDNLSVISSTNEHTALIDSQNSRLSIANSEGQIESIIDVKPNSSNGERFSCVYVDTELLYYSTSTGDPDSAYLASEQVYTATLSGGDRTVLYQQSYDASARLVNPTFMKVFAFDDDILLMRKSTDTAAIELISLVAEPGTVLGTKQLPEEVSTVLSASYDAQTERLAIVSDRYELYVGSVGTDFTKVPTQKSSAVYSDCAWGEDGYLYCIDPIAGTLDRIDPATGAATSCNCEAGCQSVSNSWDGSRISCATSSGFAIFRVADLVEDPSADPVALVDSLPYAPALAFAVIIEWVALVYLIACVIVVLVRLVVRMLRNGQSDEIIRGVLIAACVAILIGVSALYSGQFYSFTEDARHDTVASLCEISAEDAQENYIAGQQAIAEAGGINADKLEAAMEGIGERLCENCAAFAENSIGLSVMVMVWNSETLIEIEADAQDYGYRRMALDNPNVDKSLYASYLEESTDGVVRKKQSNSASENLVAYRAILDANGQISGIAIASCEVSDLAESYTSLCIELAMTLMAIAGAILLIVLEGKGTIEAFRLRKQEKKAKDGMPAIWGTRPLMLLVIMASGFDASLCVLVAQDILEAGGFANAEVLAGLPAMAAAVGGFLGNILFGMVSGKVSARKIFTSGSLLGAVFLALSFFAVMGNAFWLFCLCKLFAGVGLYFASALVYGIPLCTTDEEKRSKLFQDATMAVLSGGAMGGLVCGYVAQYLGNSWIYAFNVVPAAAALLLGLFLLPAKMFVGSNSESAKNAAETKGAKTSKGTLAIFRSPAVLALLVCVALPMVLAGGYKSILFPLFMDAGGMSKVYINNIVVFANVLVFLVSPQINRATKSLDQWVVVIASVLFSAAVLCWFMVNSTALWGILALVLLSLATKLNSPGRKLLIPREARARDLSEANANNALSIAESLLDSVKSPVLSALTVLGQSVACLCMGVLCAAGAGLFALITARAPIRGKREAKSSPDAPAAAPERNADSC